MKYKKKHRKDKKEFLNTLMWAHYADSHKGICIKYHFHHSITKLAGDHNGIVAYFKDVKYSNGEMSKYSNKDAINLEDAFFLKGKNPPISSSKTYWKTTLSPRKPLCFTIPGRLTLKSFTQWEEAAKQKKNSLKEF